MSSVPVPTKRSGSPRTLAVLVVNYFSSSAVGSLLRSLRTEAGLQFDVVVVDNSDDGDELRRLQDVAEQCEVDGRRVRVHSAGANLGYGGGNNLAFSLVRDEDPDVVLVANPDTTVASGSLLDLVEFTLAHPDDLVAIRTRQDGTDSSGLVRMSRPTGAPHELETPPTVHPPMTYPAGHFFAVSTSRFAALGGFGPEYFLYCEELDLMLRNRRLGGGVVTFSGVTATHEGGLSINGGEGRSTTSYYYGTRSRVTLYRKHRELRRYLPLFLVLRTGWALSLIAVGQRSAGSTVLRAIASGLRGRQRTSA